MGRFHISLWAVSLLLAALPGCADAARPRTDQPAEPPAHHFDLERITSGLNHPTYVGAAHPSALWVLEQPGRVVRIEGDDRSVVLDMVSMVTTGAEQGLLGIAFHPDFSTNRRLFLHWSDQAGDTRVAEFRAGSDGHSIDPQPVRELLLVNQPEENHNGGQLAFGPDGRLYFGLGDGGGAFDQRAVAQYLDQLLGKVVALDVDLPTDLDAQWDVVLYGLRNPWRFSFDRALAEMWVADEGQDRMEEVTRVRLELDEAPKNLGWSVFEGNEKVPGGQLNPAGELVAPVVTYGHDEGCSAIGGFVYTGTALPGLQRRYLYGDFCAGALWSLQGTPEGGVADVRQETAKVPQLTHIGENAEGEIVFASAAGFLYRAVPPAGS
ncbi:PQQ-dependent sugar dehydrogenase [soil metagenome]